MATIEIKGGNKLKKYLDDIAKKLEGNETLRVGFLEKARYPDGTYVAMVAAIQNYGAPAAGIPARPFFTNMVDAKSPNWGESLGNLLVKNEYDIEKALESMGAGIKGQLQASISDGDYKALSPITVMLRGMRSNDQSLVVTGKTVGEAARRVDAGESNYGASDKPLDDSAHMLASVDYEVKE